MFDRITHHLVTRDGTRIAWHTHHGEPSPPPGAPAVLLTNGVATSENFWRFLVQALSPSYQVTHWDYRGHGGSTPSPLHDYQLERHVEDLEAVVDQVRRTTRQRALHHVGFSMGVRVLLEAYRRRPETFASLTLIAGGAGKIGPAAVHVIPGAALVARAALALLSPLVPVLSPPLKLLMGSPLTWPLARLSRVVRARAPREDIELMVEHMRGMDLRAYFGSVRDMLEGDSSDVVPTIRVPTFIICAANDVMMAPDEVRRLYQRLPSARYLEISDAGHAGLVEAGDEIADAVTGFLADVEPAAR